MASFALAFLGTPRALGQNPWLWLDRGVQPGHLHRGWFLANGGNAARILLEGGGGTTLNQAIQGLGMNDRFYGVAHGVSGPCAPNGMNISGGRVSIAGATRAGFAAGTDPNNQCATAGAPLAIPNQANFTWRMMTCRGAAVPPWMGGRSVVQSAVNFLPATVTVTGSVPDIQCFIQFRVANAANLMQAQACVNTFEPWSTMTNGVPIARWYDATIVANHPANLTAIRNGPLAAYNLANGTAITLPGIVYAYNPAIPGTPPVLPGPGEVLADSRSFHLCTSNDEIGTYCYGDGTSVPCPCGNASSPGQNAGCQNSLGAAGVLQGYGAQSVSADTLYVVAAGMPNAAALFFQGSDDVAEGLGAIFGDGLRCVGGSVIRLGMKINTTGGSQFPGHLDPPISVAGSCAPGDERFYQVWYRNAASFCTSSTFNLTNALTLTWRP